MTSHHFAFERTRVGRATIDQPVPGAVVYADSEAGVGTVVFDDHFDGQIVGDASGGGWIFDASSGAHPSKGLVVKPDDVDIADPGRWHRLMGAKVEHGAGPIFLTKRSRRDNQARPPCPPGASERAWNCAMAWRRETAVRLALLPTGLATELVRDYEAARRAGHIHVNAVALAVTRFEPDRAHPFVAFLEQYARGLAPAAPLLQRPGKGWARR